MKKIISLFLALMLICTFCASVFAAEDKSEEWKSSKGLFLEPLVKGVYVGGNFEEGNFMVPYGDYMIGYVSKAKSCIVRSGEYTLKEINMDRDATLAIGGNAKLTITDHLINHKANIIVAGTLDLTNCEYAFSDGTIYIADCCANAKLLTKEEKIKNGIIHAAHCFENGTCIGCGYVCENEFHNGVYACRDCGMKIDLSQGNSLVSGSTLTEGNLAIITAIAGIVIGMAVMFFIMKNKKPVPVNAAEEEIKDEE